jgi:hypothetical protein
MDGHHLGHRFGRPLCGASRRSLRRHFSRRPRLPGALLDVAADQTSHDLGGCHVFLGAQAFEDRLLARIDENRQSSSADFESHGGPY